MRTLLAWLLMGQVAFAAEVCHTVDMTGWTQSQKNHLAAVSSLLMFDVGDVTQFTRWSNQTGEICFDSPTSDLAAVLTPQAILDRYATEEAARETARQAEIARQEAFTNEVSGNDWCEAELADLDARINAVRDGINADIDAVNLSNAAQTRTLLKSMNNTYAAGFRKVARCMRARAR